MARKNFTVGILIKAVLDRSVGRSAKQAVKSNNKIGSAVARTNRQFAKAKIARRYAGQINELRRQQRRLGGSSETVNRQLKKAEEGYDRARRSLARYGKTAESAAKRQERLARNAKRAGVAIGGAVTASVGLAMADGRELSYLQTVINAKDGDKAAAAQRSRMQAREYARRKDNSATEKELIKVEYMFNSAGLDEEASRAGARIAHKVGKITRGQAEDISAIIGTAYKQFGDDLSGNAEERMMQIGNVLTRTQLKYQIKDFSQLGEGLKEAAAGASAMNFRFTDTAAILGMLNDAGLGGSRAGTAFNAMARNLNRAGDELGFAVSRFQNGQLDLISTFTDLDAALAHMSIDERSVTLQKLFGDEGMKGIVPLLKRLQEMGIHLDHMQDILGSDTVESNYAIFNEDDLARLERAKEHVRALGTGIGRVLLPPFNAVADTVGTVLGGLGRLVDTVPLVGQVISWAALGTVMLGTAMTTTTAATWAWNAAMMVSANQKMIGFLGHFRKGLIGLAVRALPMAKTAVLALGRALMLNPIGLAVTAIAVGGFLLIKYWKPVSRFFIGLWKSVSDPTTRAGKLFRTVFAFTPLGMITRNFGPAIGWLKNVIAEPPRVAALAWAGLKTVLSFSPVGLIVSRWSGLEGVFKGIMGGLEALVGAAVKRITDKLLTPVRVFNAIKNRFGKDKAVNDNEAKPTEDQSPDDKPKRGPGGGPKRGPGLLVRFFRNKTINETEDRHTSLNIGRAVKETEERHNVLRFTRDKRTEDVERRVTETGTAADIVPLRPSDYAQAPAPSSVKKEVHVGGDTFHMHFHNVTDAASIMDEIEARLRDRTAERRKAAFHD